jgi:hypothetical protein
MSAGAQPLRPGGQAATSQLPRVAAAVFVAIAVVLWVDVLFRARLVDAIGSSGYSTTAGLVISAVAIPIAAGLWLRLLWAWWAGLIGAALQLLSHLLYIVVTTATGETVGAVGWLIAVLLVVFLIVLLLPATRNACFRPRAGDLQ